MSTEQELRAEIIEKVREYYKAAFSHQPVFEPAVSPVHYAGRVFDECELANLVDASLDFWLTYGRYSRSFEKLLAAYLGVPHALLVNSGSSANLLAFMALTSEQLGNRKINRGDEVITVAACFPTTVAPIIQYGAVPVFIDIHPETLNVDISQLDAALSPKTKCVFLAHTLGNPFHARAIKAFCDRHDLWLIEDNCDSLGAEFDNQKCGTIGDIGTSSFYPAHHITTGEGGAVYTKNSLLHKILLSMRDWGRDCWCDSGVDNTCGKRFSGQFGRLPQGYDHKYVYSHFGYNLKVSDMQAAIGVAQLEKLPEFINKRRENFAYLAQALNDIKPWVSFIKAEPESKPSWFGFGLMLNKGTSFTRNGLAEFLEKKRIQTRNLFSGNIVKHPCFDKLIEPRDYRIVGNLKNTDDIMENMLWIGVYPGMNKSRLDYMIEQILQFFRGEE